MNIKIKSYFVVCINFSYDTTCYKSGVFSMMKIEVWSDFVCPFCYIGKRHLEEALTLFSHVDCVTVEYKSFSLSPNSIFHSQTNDHERWGEDHDSLAQTRMLREDIQKQAQAVGLTYNFDHMKPSNTFDAHRMVKYAVKEQKGQDMVERLLRAYFMEGACLSDHETLFRLAAGIGLTPSKVEQILQTDRYETKVKCDQMEAEQIGVQSVPFYIFDEQYAVKGVQPSEVLVDVLEQVWEGISDDRKRAFKHTPKSQTTYCSGESCNQNEGATSD